MFTKSASLALLAVLASATPTVDTAAASCTEVAYIIAARGTITDPAQCGTSDHLANLAEITGAIQNAGRGPVAVAPVNYPASGGNPCQPGYTESRKDGEKDMRTKIIDRSRACGTRANIVLLGYSQGAQVITDLISGGSSTGVSALGDQYIPRIKAVVLIANPAQTPNAPYNNRAPAPNGSQAAPEGAQTPFKPDFVIANPAKVEALGDRVVAYCAQGDIACDSPNPNGGAIHGAEVETWQQPAINFILSHI